MKKLLTAITLFLTLLFTFTFPIPTFANPSPTITRLSGTDRYSTATSIARQGWTQSDYCILTYGENYPDALSAVPLAKKYNAPILLTTSSSIPDTTKQELIDLQTKNVIIIGGTGVISTSVESELQSMGITPTRIAGLDRYETSIKIAQQFSSPTEVFVATGEDYPDALSIASIAGIKQDPIILVPKDTLPDVVKNYISSLNVNKTYAIGDSSIIDDSVCNQFPNPERIVGVDKYERNVAIDKKFENNFNSDSVCLATGEGFADALTGAVYASKLSEPIVLVNNASPDNTKSYYQQRLDYATNVYIFGGAGVVSDSLIQGLTETTNHTTPSPNPGKSNISRVNVTTVAGMAPALPSAVTATMSDGTTRTVNVTWASIDASQYATPGTFTVSGIANSNVQAMANVTVTYASISCFGLFVPSNINSVLGDSQIITLKAWDTYGNPIPNQKIYLQTGTNGLWITQVNGNYITGNVNMGTLSSTSTQTVNTPVPLFNIGTGASAPAYSSASVTGLTANHLNDNINPVIALTTGADGTVSITLADGNVTYVSNTASATATNSYTVDSGTPINQLHLNFFPNLAQTRSLGSTLVNWTEVPTPSISNVNAINIKTTAGTAPVLPTTVTANMSDDTTSNVAVTWSNIDASQYASAGTFTVNGTIDNSTVQAVANVTVNVAVAPTITITSASVINGTITVTLSRPTWSDYSVPIAKPAITDFSVTASGVAVTPTAISTTGAVVNLTVPTTTTDQPIVYSVSYQGGTSVVANKQVTDVEPNSVMVGQPFNVVLVAVTDGGYNWTYTTDTEAVKFVQLTSSSLCEPMVLGTCTEEVFTFRATQAGSFKLHFSEERWWVGADGSPLENSDYTINVK
ncbi:MAG: cell wall-binding repeat-containing protein [Desulfosporosinus sp.]|nr:cell wall-binding repeat-containing protein [Desulfosporosinus sp.]